MAEREDSITLKGLKMPRKDLADVERIAEAKGVSRTQFVNNAIEVGVKISDFLDQGGNVVFLSPGAIFLAGRVYGRFIGGISGSDPKIPTDPEDLPPNVIPFRPRR